MDAEISIYHSLIFRRQISDPALHVHCTTSIAYTSRIDASGSEVNMLSRVVKFANSNRLAKFEKIKTPFRNIWRIQYTARVRKKGKPRFGLLFLKNYQRKDTSGSYFIESCNSARISSMTTAGILNPFRTKTPKYLFPRGNEPLLHHQIGNRNFFIFITNQ